MTNKKDEEHDFIFKIVLIGKTPSKKKKKPTKKNKKKAIRMSANPIYYPDSPKTNSAKTKKQQ